MPFKFLTIRVIFVALGAASLSLSAVGTLAAPLGTDLPSGAAVGVPASTCNTRDGCIDAILSAARAGRHIDQLSLVAGLARTKAPAKPVLDSNATRPNRGGEAIAVGNVDAILVATLQGARKDYASMPQYRRALALAYFKAGQVQEAERELREAIGETPTDAQFWADLAIIFHQQGKADQAVSALIVADTWAQDPKTLRMGYEQAAQAASIKGMEQVYRDALQALAENAATLERFDAGLPPLVDPANQRNIVGTVIFGKCEKPEWPRASLRYEETGKVTLAFFVDAEGKLLRARKLESSGYVELDNAAFISISTCTFRPAYVGGKPTPAWVRMQYVWSLD